MAVGLHVQLQILSPKFKIKQNRMTRKAFEHQRTRDQCSIFFIAPPGRGENDKIKRKKLGDDLDINRKKK